MDISGPNCSPEDYLCVYFTNMHNTLPITMYYVT